MKYINYAKKIITILIGASIITISTPAQADSTDVPYLIMIRDAVNNVLNAVNNSVLYLTHISNMAQTWLNADNATNDAIDWSDKWGNQQNWLASISSNMMQNEQAKFTLTTNVLNDFFNTNGGNEKLINTDLNINDLSYTSMLNAPLINPDTRGDSIDLAKNYLINSSGLALPWTKPDATFRGQQNDINNYTKVYKTNVAVQTYNLFALAKLYQDSKTNTAEQNLRQQLITQSSNADWFLSISTNDLGWVLRQILLYISQNYVLADQMLQLNRQIAASIAMNNTLLLANNYIQSATLLDHAKVIGSNANVIESPMPPM